MKTDETLISDERNVDIIFGGLYGGLGGAALGCILSGLAGPMAPFMAAASATPIVMGLFHKALAPSTSLKTFFIAATLAGATTCAGMAFSSPTP